MAVSGGDCELFLADSSKVGVLAVDPKHRNKTDTTEMPVTMSYSAIMHFFVRVICVRTDK